MSDTVTITPASIEEIDSGGWELKGTAAVKGDTYDVVYGYTFGEYGGDDLTITLDGVEQNRDTYVYRSYFYDTILDMYSEVLWSFLADVRLAQREIAARYIDKTATWKVDEAESVL